MQAGDNTARLQLEDKEEHIWVVKDKRTVLKRLDEEQASNAVVQQEQFRDRRNEAGRTELENGRNGAVQAERACEQSK